MLTLITLLLTALMFLMFCEILRLEEKQDEQADRIETLIDFHVSAAISGHFVDDPFNMQSFQAASVFTTATNKGSRGFTACPGDIDLDADSIRLDYRGPV